ncbi:MAG: hypothetical protein QOF04_2030, partial [Solirubrobacteraceae bacterium]|nr:hypothetical protein [Solirubrobacteraceae bacterium]
MDEVDGQDEHGAQPLDNWATRVIEASLDAVVTIDATGRVVQWNAAAESLFGHTREEALGQALATLVIPPDLQAAHWAGLLRIVAGEPPRILDRRIELRAMRRGGEEFPVELTVTRVSESPPLFTGFVRDLSGLREAETRGSHMQRVLSDAEQLVHMGSWDLALATGDAVWSDELYRIHGFEPGSVEPSADMLVALVHPEDRDWVKSLLDTVVAHPERVPPEGTHVEYRIVRTDGSVRAVRAHGRIEFDEHGVPARWVG